MFCVLISQFSGNPPPIIFRPILSVKNIYGKDPYGCPWPGDNPHTERRLYHQPVAWRICLPRGCGPGRSSPPYPSLPPSKSRSGIRALPASPSVRSSSLPGSLPYPSTTATRPSPILLRRVRPRWPTMVRFPFPSSYPELPYTLSFAWSKAKSGTPGKDGADASMLGWVKGVEHGQDTYQQQYGHYPETVHRYQEQRRYYFRYCHRFIPAFRQDSFRNGYCRAKRLVASMASRTVTRPFT